MTCSYRQTQMNLETFSAWFILPNQINFEHELLEKLVVTIKMSFRHDFIVIIQINFEKCRVHTAKPNWTQKVISVQTSKHAPVCKDNPENPILMYLLYWVFQIKIHMILHKVKSMEASLTNTARSWHFLLNTYPGLKKYKTKTKRYGSDF